MKQPSHYRKLKYVEAGLGIAKNALGLLGLLWLLLAKLGINLP